MAYNATNLYNSSNPYSDVPNFITPCGTGNVGFNHYYVTTNQTVNITFGGTPPYKLSQTIYNNNEFHCSVHNIQLNSSTYSWAVNPSDYSYSDNFTLGSSVIFVAVQTTGKNSRNYYPYYLSQNYTLYTNTSGPANVTAKSGASATKPLSSKWAALLLTTVVAAGLAVM